MSCETTFNTYQQCNPVKQCGSVTAKRAYLFQTKELIRQALNAKGLDVTTDDTFRSYAEYIMQLPSLNNVVTAIIDTEGEKHVGDVTIDKTFIGLDKVNNTTDLEKPISNATQAALDLKANNDATSIVTEKWKAQLRINNVDNTTDLNKPVSTATQAALDKKADKATTLAGYGIEDAKIENGVITLGENTIEPLTSTSLINGANVTGVVAEAGKATKDSDNNIISETYAKASDIATTLNQKQNKEDSNLVTPSKTITDAINEAWNYASLNNGDLNTTLAGTNSNIDFNTWGANLGIPEIKTSLDDKQNKLITYSEHVISGAAENTPSYTTASIEAAYITITPLQGPINLDGPLSGEALSHSIPTLESAVDSKILSEKAIVTALSTKASTDLVNALGKTLEEDYQQKEIAITGLPDTVEGALADLRTKQDNNTSNISALGLKTQFVSADETEHMTEIAGILNIKNDDTTVADIKINGTSLADTYQKTISAGDGINVSNNTVSAKLLTVCKKSPDASGDIDLSSNDVDTYSHSQIDDKLLAKQNKLIAGDGISISDTNVISVSGVIKGTVTSVNNITPDDSGNVTIAAANISDVYSKTEVNNELAAKQNSSDDTLTTTAKTVVGAINELDADVAENISDISELKSLTTILGGAIDAKADKATTLAGYDITDAKIENGVITLGENTIEPLTPESSIAADKIDGTVSSATKASQDGEGNVISTTYAKSTDVNTDLALKQNITDNTLATTAKTIPAAINEVNSALSTKQDVSNLVTSFSATTSDTKYPSEKLVYSSLGTLSQSITSLENDTQALSNNKANKSTTLAGYGIEDAYTKDEVNTDLSLKQDKTDNSLITEDKTVVGAINELVNTKQKNLTTYVEDDSGVTITDSTITLNGALMGNCISDTISGNAATDKIKVPTVAAVYDAIQPLKVTSTVTISVTPESIETATAITDALAKPARVVVNPNIANTGAVYIQESDTYSTVNPIYPDPTNNVYEFSNMQNVKVFIDSLGDSVDLSIEYRG